jgi:hypothetical protein
MSWTISLSSSSWEILGLGHHLRGDDVLLDEDLFGRLLALEAR